MKRRLICLPVVIFIITFLLFSPVFGLWNVFEETNITGIISGSIKKGSVFKTDSGNIYEVVDYVYLYEYEYNPGVIVLRDGEMYKLIIDGFDEQLLCNCLTCPAEFDFED